MTSEKRTSTVLEDGAVNVKAILAALWAGHFLLWTFGDMLALLQETVEPASDDLLVAVAVPLALIQSSMILFSLIGKPNIVRWVTIGLGAVYAVFNLGYIAEATVGWQYLLGIGYLAFSGMIIWFAWNWPRREAAPDLEEA